jgi:formate hydrogenlyase subunit 3/multisubunit Na+/H+ antiporter MnhD subunit
VQRHKTIKLAAILLAVAIPLLVAQPVLAADGSVGQVEAFIRNIIKVVAGLAGLIATGFFVVGGFVYITSTGNPERLDRAKHTLLYSGIGLAIVIAAFVISNIVTDLATGAFGK